MIEGMPFAPEGEEIPRNEEIRGRRRPGQWQPYNLWVADLWECPDCGHQLITGWGAAPFAERHHAEFERRVLTDVTRDEFGRSYFINDC